MDIRNVTEFRNYIVANQLASLSRDIEAVVICVADYERGCSCWKAGDRDKIYANCKGLYVRAVQTISRQFAPQFTGPARTTITFLQDGVQISKVG